MTFLLELHRMTSEIMLFCNQSLSIATDARVMQLLNTELFPKYTEEEIMDLSLDLEGEVDFKGRAKPDVCTIPTPRYQFILK